MPIDPSANPLALLDIPPNTAGADAIAQSNTEALAAANRLFEGNNQRLIAASGRLDCSVPLRLPSYTVAGLPSPSTAGQMVYVSNESGGAVVAFADGTNWRRVTDRAVVS